MRQLTSESTFFSVGTEKTIDEDFLLGNVGSTCVLLNAMDRFITYILSILISPALSTFGCWSKPQPDLLLQKRIKRK